MKTHVKKNTRRFTIAFAVHEKKKLPGGSFKEERKV